MSKALIRIALLAAVITGIVLAVLYRDQLSAEALQQWIGDAGSTGPILFFILLYAVATVVFLPGSVITLADGAIFGPVWGTLYNLTGATLGATLAFLVARYLAADWVEQRSGGLIKRLKNGVESEGWRFVAFVRLVPLFPFNALNYALGLTRIKLSHYIIASYLCMLPGGIAYTYLGYAGREAVAGGEGLIQKILLAVALLALVSFLPRLIAMFRRGPEVDATTLKQQLDSSEDLLLLDVRSAEDYIGEQGHVAGSLLIPLEQLKQRLDELSDYQERRVVTICRTDRKSAKAARILVEKGFADVHVAKMGMTDWLKCGYPVETQMPQEAKS
ncbi:sulfurtransferase [Solemya pervernicosa gill symbiont]|uniref:TVP38/TMEM64 family membrane protein n=1 Tax=Solemya pervernicosa gill symbiont TaxID=642797 RepID=A0A1T2L062_9GAMM|nr:VTT domain-containing protein [Solemya pervernicosa gill symbiont]OOZ38462.1 sulfurtransferase [Solemya pervernicosa gill symbiont]